MLTNAAVRAARPKPRAYKMSDGQGLLLHVAPTGSKSWRMRYARAKGWTSVDNPAEVGEALASAPAGGRQAALVDVDELRALMRAVAAVPAAPILHLASRMLALTTVRLAALRGMRWQEVEDLDGAGATWRVPAVRMKLGVGRKLDAAHDHLVPLSAAAIAVLREARDVAGDLPGPAALVFPGRRGGDAPIGAGALGELYVRAGYAGRHVRAAFARRPRSKK